MPANGCLYIRERKDVVPDIFFKILAESEVLTGFFRRPVF